MLEKLFIADLGGIYQIETKRQLLAPPLRVAVVGLQGIRVRIRGWLSVIEQHLDEEGYLFVLFEIGSHTISAVVEQAYRHHDVGLALVFGTG